MTETSQIKPANDGADDKDSDKAEAQPCCPRQTDIKAALLARRLQRERLNRAIEELLRPPANTQKQHDE